MVCVCLDFLTPLSLDSSSDQWKNNRDYHGVSWRGLDEATGKVVSTLPGPQKADKQARESWLSSRVFLLCGASHPSPTTGKD